MALSTKRAEGDGRLVLDGMLPEVLSRRSRVGRVTEELDHFRDYRQRINLNRAINTALVRLFALEEECFAVPANVDFQIHPPLQASRYLILVEK